VIKGGELGRLVSFESHFDPFPARAAPRRVARERRSRRRNAPSIWGRNLIDEALTLFGAPDTITGECARGARARSRG